MPWNYCLDPFEDTECGFYPTEEEPDEDAAYDEARERAAGWDD